MALVRLNGGAWVEAASISVIAPQQHVRDEWYVIVTFRDGVGYRFLGDDGPMGREAAHAMCDDIASVVVAATEAESQ